MPPRSNARPSRLENRLLRRISRASQRFDLLGPNERVMVAVSGGKDSLVLLRLMWALRSRLPFDIELVAVHLDQGFPGQDASGLIGIFERFGVEHRIIRRDTWGVLQRKIAPGQTPCPLCARLRRGALYEAARELGATRVALGHHREDIIETALMNMFFSGRLKAMPPRLTSDDGRHVVIRPLALCAEADIIAFAEEQGLQGLSSARCAFGDDTQRRRIKELVRGLAAENPKVPGNILAALGHVVPSHLLDPDL